MAESENVEFNAAWLNERSEYFAGIRDDLLNLRFQGAFHNKKIAIIGSWDNAGEIKDILNHLGLTLTHIADNNPKKQGISRLGIISQSVESLVNEKELVILVINNYFWKDIQNQLGRLGFVKERDFYIVYGGEKFRLRSQIASDTLLLPDVDWAECKDRAKNAFDSYTYLEEKYNGMPIWLMHQPSLGDLYIFSLFLPYAMGVRTISECECVLIVTKNSVKKLAVVLGYKYIELITFEEANRNWLLLMRMMGEHLNVQNAVYHGLNNILESLASYSKLNFRDSFTKYVFHLRNEVDPIYPMFPKRKEYVLAQFKDYGLKLGKTVVISPYAGHFIALIDEEHWKKLITALTEKGYSVCTNCGSSKELPLPGTKAPFIELQDCVEFVEMAGYFIGVRSGFCDLVCMANCKKIVIYETGAPASSIDYFGFKSMGIGRNIIELINDCIHIDDLIECVIEKIIEGEQTL